MTRKYPETELVHRPLMQVVTMHYKRYPVLEGLFHVPNEGVRSKAQHGMLVGLGMRAGVSDLVLPRARRGFLGLALELKAPGKIKTATPEQKSFLIQQADEGWLCCVSDDPVEAWKVLAWYAQGRRHHEPVAEFSCQARVLWILDGRGNMP